MITQPDTSSLLTFNKKAGIVLAFRKLIAQKVISSIFSLLLISMWWLLAGMTKDWWTETAENVCSCSCGDKKKKDKKVCVPEVLKLNIGNSRVLFCASWPNKTAKLSRTELSLAVLQVHLSCLYKDCSSIFIKNVGLVAGIPGQGCVSPTGDPWSRCFSPCCGLKTRKHGDAAKFITWPDTQSSIIAFAQPASRMGQVSIPWHSSECCRRLGIEKKSGLAIKHVAWTGLEGCRIAGQITQIGTVLSILNTKCQDWW